MKVAGLGQCSLDYLIVVDGYPREDTKKEVVDWTVQGGGPVATALVSLSRLSIETAFMGVVSNDEAGGEIRRGLVREDVDITHLLERRGGTSQTAFITINRVKDTRTILWQRPTVRAIEPSEVGKDLLDGAALLLLDGLFGEASLKAAEMAREAKIPVMVDAGRVREGTEELLSHADYIVASEEFAGEFGGTPEKALRKLEEFKPKAATITLGNRGSMTVSAGERFHQSAFDVDVVDTTGAGDVFHGGYIYGLLQRWEIKKTVEFASAFAGLKCREVGGRAGIPTLQETMEFTEA
ncbi:MAG: sugar kinase [Deltaproteobacteria bacterium]|nr:sugar kinase [Deltaproteobacteria bacterium]